MESPAVPPDESARLDELHSLAILDTPADSKLDSITRLARKIFAVDICVISLVDRHRQWFISRQGLDVSETSREVSFCGHAILGEDVFIVEDAHTDARFADNPLVTGVPFVRFYAGMPLHGPNGHRIGALCLINSTPRTFDHKNIVVLSDFASTVEAHLHCCALRKAFQELQASEARTQAMLARRSTELQMVIDNMPSLISYWDADLRNQFANQLHREWFGVSPEQMTGMHLSEILGEKRLAKVMPYIKAALSGVPQMFEHTLENKNSRTLDGLVSYIPDIFGGNVRGFYAVATDITPLKLARARERAAQAQLQAVIDAASTFAIIATNSAGVISLFSMGARFLLGYHARNVVGKLSLLDLLLQSELDQHIAALQQSLGRPLAGFADFVRGVHENGTESHTWTMIRADGSYLLVKLVISIIHNDDGEAAGYLAVASDFTDQRRLEATLMLAKEQAEAVSRAKTEFVANVSHELRTPMNAVLGMAHLLNQTPLSMQQQNYVDMIRTSAQSLMDLLNDVLDFAKIEAGRMELSPVTFSLDERLKTLAGIMAMNTADKDIELAIEVNPDVPQWFLGDAHRLQQVLTNLVGNATKFTERGEIVLNVTAEQPVGQVVHLTFSVRDTGVGISDHDLERIFSPFTQGDASTTRRFGGTGLGLTICRHLISLLDGSISVDSLVGIGTEFHVTVPLEVATIPDDAQIKTGPLHLLVIDNSTLTRSAMHKAIIRWSWTADVVDSISMGIGLLKRQSTSSRRYDAVVIGRQIAHESDPGQIRNLQRCWGEDTLPLVILSRAFSRHGRETSMALWPAHAVLLKPVTPITLLDAVQDARALTRRHPGRARQAQPATSATLLSGVRILLVEDHPANQAVASALLQRAGAEVEIASDGAKAVATLEQRRRAYDLVLMDIQMPVMDGFAATVAIRQQLGLTIPIVAMSAGVMEHERQRCLACGMNDFIAKPIDPASFVQTLVQKLPWLRNTHTGAHEESVAEGIFDADALLAVPDITEEFQARIEDAVRGLVIDAPARMLSAKQWHAEGLHAEALHALHTVHGSVGMLGAKRFVQSARALEIALRETRTQDLPGLWDQAEAHLQETIQLARQWLARRGFSDNSPS